MTHTRLWVAATIIAGIIAVGFIVSVPHTRDIPAERQSLAAASTTPAVSLRDSYRKGVHTLSGSVDAPNPCTSLTASATLAGTTTDGSILLSISMPEDTGICLQTITPLSFSTTIAAGANIPVSVTVNGAPASVTPL